MEQETLTTTGNGHNPASLEAAGPAAGLESEQRKAANQDVSGQIIEIDLMDIARKPEWKELLFEIISREGMNPWNIDLELLTQRFIEEIKKREKLNLRVSANVILAASILLRSKSDRWVLRQETVEQYYWIPDHIIQEPYFPELDASLRNTERKVSVDDLLFAIEDIMSKQKRKAQRRPAEHVVPDPLLALVEFSGKNFEQKMQRVFEKIMKKADSEKLVLFSGLFEKKTVEETVGHLVPILHLANDKKIAVWQDEVFGEIFINLLENAKEKTDAGRTADRTAAIPPGQAAQP